ncbi:hypothetical protein SCHPADRAFT_941761 [Schizopora paradoxa]|uniref:Uncharacterized protein n=1 Tax=Schizopora paradoxa TaxID=27342 RepID=A0A0H2S483_9AGAM|nr:hypothetical protein SCHPADRAFT_941761 [Schizopora paradoxa]
MRDFSDINSKILSPRFACVTAKILRDTFQVIQECFSHSASLSLIRGSSATVTAVRHAMLSVLGSLSNHHGIEIRTESFEHGAQKAKRNLDHSCQRLSLPSG